MNVLVNNVGGLSGRRWETTEGIEATLAMNFVGPFTLTYELLPLLQATIDGRLAETKIELDERAAVTVVMASAGYPGNVLAGQEIFGLEECAQMQDVQIFHAGTRRQEDAIFSSGGRVLSAGSCRV